MELTARVSILGMVVRCLLCDDGADDMWGIPAHSVFFVNISWESSGEEGGHVHIPDAMESLTTMKVMANLVVRHCAAALDPESIAECVHIRPVSAGRCCIIDIHRVIRWL